ncbi:MAG: hypothetical protein QOH12_2651 [Solirubrobacteraceae bacterium]|jgi:hypothetical protein|nr:hypothetical protein [Solirubrobacteraceae bacterium]
MSVLGVLAVVALLAGVVWIVSGPLRSVVASKEARDDGRAALEAARDAKYREILDTDMDHRTGKLSDDDFKTLDRQRRSEAVEILRKLDELG